MSSNLEEAGRIVFCAAAIAPVPYTIANKGKFVQVQARTNWRGIARYIVSLSDGYETYEKLFMETSDAIEYLADRL